MGIESLPFPLAPEQPYFRGSKRRKIGDPLRLDGGLGIRRLFDRSTEIIKLIAGRKLG
jgi:hypothetical protein